MRGTNFRKMILSQISCKMDTKVVTEGSVEADVSLAEELQTKLNELEVRHLFTVSGPHADIRGISTRLDQLGNSSRIHCNDNIFKTHRGKC